RGRAHGGHRQEDRQDHQVRDHRLRRHRADARPRARRTRERARDLDDRDRGGHRRVPRRRAAVRCAAAVDPHGRRAARSRRAPPCQGAERSGRQAGARGQGMTVEPPSPETELAALHDLATEIGTTTSEPALVERALDILVRLLPRRALCVRVLDVRTGEPARGYVRGAPLRHAALTEPITITEVELSRARLKAAVAASARLIVRDRWDSPFTGIATGIAIPLAAGGELYGVLDVGYAPSADARAVDELGARAFGSQLALGLR